MYATLTPILIIVVTLSMTIYNIFPVLSPEDGDTISAILHEWSREWVVLSYLWGLLGGHWFLGYYRALTTPQGDLVLTLFSLWAVFVANVVLRAYEVETPTWGHVVALVVGVIIGHFFWSQA